MRYINKLEIEKKAAEARAKALEEGLNMIRRYLSLEKFSKDIMVNKNDIFLRIEETLQEADRAENLIYYENK